MPADSLRKDPVALRLVLCWHMHQPEYREAGTGRYALPWTYLHAIKDYVDMAAHLEATPGARAVVNFAPVLLEQIRDYAVQVAAFLQQGKPISDPVLALLGAQSAPAGATERMQLAEACTRANRKRLIEPNPDYRMLADMLPWLRQQPDAAIYLGDQYFFDLVTWYHLMWMGETVRRSDPRIEPLMKQGRNFTPGQRRMLMEVIGELLGEVIARYRRLAHTGQVELSFTPYAHPIMPLLLDLTSAREAVPETALPEAPFYPGGDERVRWHVARGMAVFEEHFGLRPAGCWPSEGGVSDATLRLLAQEGIRWAASGEGVLVNSLRASSGPQPPAASRSWLYRPYRYDAESLAVFFRDDGLSDSIGFRYADWHGDDAVADFIHQLEQIAEQLARTRRPGDPTPVVSVILDGENAWEYYPNNAFYFLSALYPRLVDHPAIELTTFSEALDEGGPPLSALSRVVAGSWVYGNFETWIGSADKNRGWDMLIDAKVQVDRVLAEGRLTPAEEAAVLDQLAVCEGSDWCWWFGDYNPSSAVGLFERLYRQHLTRLYLLMGAPPPGYLSHAVSRGSGEPVAGGVMRTGQKTV
ncbi:glycoside hydrolase family 57 protein [Ectothiorhodospira lacustris]|uniref:glycoside hydrolase family 57 protein n=1 Tax=Ectothiorhodospira lacustris TaxID=2899127 RepID=UPI001EE8BD17|nr:glycoside hydrolase family 57 protein [Ectothiorhodospira lacustris]MCG5502164.1 glycoside hydrolase [Ectothiorhodospira lacustris]MCG5509280.1 glycoside hydrolase [Ectothiorhodospira lacustris]MCG5521334.1 glycoside hydrolase [Ectothiorhodospira lacustris]